MKELPGWKTPAMRQRHPHFLKKLRRNIEDVKAVLDPLDELLDVGCYHGHMYRQLGHERYTGVDIFPDNVAEARRLNPGVKFEQGDLFELVGTWDVILCCRVLMHLPSFEEAIARLRGCARRKLVVMIPIAEVDSCKVETIKGEKVYFRTFAEKTVQATGGIILHREPYSTVIYG